MLQPFAESYDTANDTERRSSDSQHERSQRHCREQRPGVEHEAVHRAREHHCRAGGEEDTDGCKDEEEKAAFLADRDPAEDDPGNGDESDENERNQIQILMRGEYPNRTFHDLVDPHRCRREAEEARELE